MTSQCKSIQPTCPQEKNPPCNRRLRLADHPQCLPSSSLVVCPNSPSPSGVMEPPQGGGPPPPPSLPPSPSSSRNPHTQLQPRRGTRAPALARARVRVPTLRGCARSGPLPLPGYSARHPPAFQQPYGCTTTMGRAGPNATHRAGGPKYPPLTMGSFTPAPWRPKWGGVGGVGFCAFAGVGVFMPPIFPVFSQYTQYLFFFFPVFRER